MRLIPLAAPGKKNQLRPDPRFFILFLPESKVKHPLVQKGESAPRPVDKAFPAR
jgi:hypothetical protein